MLYSLIAALAISSASALSIAPNTDSKNDVSKFCAVQILQHAPETTSAITMPFGGNVDSLERYPLFSNKKIPFFSNKLSASVSYDVTMQADVGVGGSKPSTLTLNYHDGAKIATLTAHYDPKSGLSASYSDFDNVSKQATAFVDSMDSCGDFPCGQVPISIANDALQLLFVRDSTQAGFITFKTVDGLITFAQGDIETDEFDGEHASEYTPHAVLAQFTLAENRDVPKAGVANGFCIQGGQF